MIKNIIEVIVKNSIIEAIVKRPPVADTVAINGWVGEQNCGV